MPANSAYPFETAYGCGLPQRVGSVENSSGNAMAIQAEVFSQLLQEASVASSPAPTVSVEPIPGGGETIGISYTDQSGSNQNFTFDLS